MTAYDAQDDGYRSWELAIEAMRKEKAERELREGNAEARKIARKRAIVLALGLDND
jgi:hypothetical protein